MGDDIKGARPEARPLLPGPVPVPRRPLLCGLRVTKPNVLLAGDACACAGEFALVGVVAGETPVLAPGGVIVPEFEAKAGAPLSDEGPRKTSLPCDREPNVSRRAAPFEGVAFTATVARPTLGELGTEFSEKAVKAPPVPRLFFLVELGVLSAGAPDNEWRSDSREPRSST